MKPKLKKNGHKNGSVPKFDSGYGLGKPKFKREDLTKLARKNVGGRDRFKNITAYKEAIKDELARLKSTNTNKDLLEDVGGELVEATRMGQAPAYRKEFAHVARLVCSLYGSSIVELAKFFRTDHQQIEAWTQMHPEFHKAVHDRATEMNTQIMGRLARRALGFYAKTEKVFYDVKRGDVIKVDTKEYFPPSESAIMFWLKNRMPEHWKDIKDINSEENKKITLEIYKNFESLTAEQASDAYQELLKVESTPPRQETRPQRSGAKVTDVVDERETGGNKAS